MTALIPRWTDDDRAAFMTRPLAFDHDLLSTGLFTEAAIARLLETHPDELTDVNINEIADDGTSRVRTGTRGGLSGEALLDATREGRLWFNLRQAFGSESEGVAGRFFAELAACNPGFRPRHIYANLLVSAPKARVPYHADTPGVVLIHLIGRKRIYIYPNAAPHLADEPMERVALRETTEDLPYDPAWDADAAVFDLEPGQAVVWPINAPHRIDNLGTLNVSLSCEFMTWEARLRHGAYYANGTLRRRFGLSPRPVAQTSTIGRAARWAASVGFKAIGINRAAERACPVEFDVAAGARG